VRSLDVSLYVILDKEIEERLSIEDFTRQVIAGGATALQVRLKSESAREILDFTRRVQSAAGGTGVPVIVNDRFDVALALGADGVHVGEEDMPVADARRVCGDAMIVGASTRTIEGAREAVGAGADYLGVGPIYATPVKPGVKPISLDILDAMRHEISLPIVAIGGISHRNAASPLEHGADGVAVISALRQCLDPKEAASRLRAAVDKAKRHS
jgi:thiamine-phosphate pyrophosphorylase